MIRTVLIVTTGLVAGVSAWFAVEQFTNGYGTAAALTTVFGVGYVVVGSKVIGLYKEDS